MDDEIIIEMGRSDIHAAKLEDVKAAVNEMVELIKSKEPRIIFYNAYVNEDGTQLTVLQAHPDSASMEFHTEVIGPFLAKKAKLFTPSKVDIYGKPSQSLLDKLQPNEFVSGVTVAVHELIAGFSRV